MGFAVSLVTSADQLVVESTWHNNSCSTVQKFKRSKPPISNLELLNL
jgi:subtilase family serine protease